MSNRTNRSNAIVQTAKRLALSAFVIITFIGYAIRDHFSSDNTNGMASSLPVDNNNGSNNTSNGASTVAEVPTETNVPPTATQNGENESNGDLQSGINSVANNLADPSLNGNQQQQNTTTPPTVTNVPATATNAPATATKVSPTATKAVVTNGYKDGTYTGDSVDAYFGNVQVKATIQGGKITDVQFLDYPHDRRTSQRINSFATPYLQREAIQAQSSRVNIVSGATLTSEGFIQSLQTALNKAKA